MSGALADPAAPAPPRESGEVPLPPVPAVQTPQRSCANCGAPMQATQDWCLQCGAGAPGSLYGSSSPWRSATAVIGLAAILALGAAAAGYAALSKEDPKPKVVRAYVPPSTPVAPVTSTPAPTATSPAGGIGTPTTLGTSKLKLKLPKIPLKSATPGGIPTTTPTVPKITTPVVPSAPVSVGKPIAPGEAKGEPLVLDTNAATTYNPYAYPASDFGDPSLTIDGDPTTGWTAQVEPSVAPKMAEGVVIDLRTAKRIAALELITSTPGMTIQVYGSTAAALPTSITDPSWVKLSSNIVEHKRRLHLALHDSRRAFRFITLWISRAPASAVGTPQAPGHVSVAEVELFPPA